MFGIINYKLFVISGILLNMTPGADTIYILSKAGVGGRKCGIASALGVSTGLMIHTFLAALGLSAILASSAAAFNIMKLAGAAYLVVMGISTIISKKPLLSVDENGKESTDTRKAYRQGVLTNALNPKAALFFLVLLPQFVSADNTYGPIPFLILGATLCTTSTVWCVFLAYISSFVSRLLQKSDKAQKWAQRSAGMIYVVLGLNVLRAKSGS